MPGLVVVSGGEAGVFYVRQLLRAVRAERLETRRILVVDRDPGCAAARVADPLVRLEVGDWVDWLSARAGELSPEDRLVPYHWAPHLLLDVLARWVERAGGRVSRRRPGPARGTPFERETAAGDRALSYATWVCPTACIEPAVCPHTRGPKDWSLARELAVPRSGDPVDEALVFPSLHLVWGVGGVPVAALHAARESVCRGLAAGTRRYLVATASHCHGLASVIDVAPREEEKR